MKKILLIVSAVFTLSTFAYHAGPRSSDIKDHYLKIYKANWDRYRSEIENARTREDALRIVEKAKKRVAAALPVPQKRPPLKVVCTGIMEYDTFRVEKLIIKTRENFSMTANFYMPKKYSGKLPAILFLCGHGYYGKADYRTAASNFAKQGCAVLVLDPIQQGERFQYLPPQVLGMTAGHNLFNRQLITVGETFGEWRLYDAVRGIDYLLSRYEIDPSRIGVNGNSGGGTMTALTAAVDNRIAAAAPSCYITTFYHNTMNELPVDGEQVFYRMLADGGEMADFILAQAPRPYRILSQQKDFFDIRGARETYKLAKKIYTLLGKEENISMTEAPHTHGYSRELRESAYDFFGKQFNFKSIKEPEKNIIPEIKDVLCLKTESVIQLKGERSIQSFIRKKADAYKKIRQEKNLSNKELEKTLHKMLNIPDKIPLVNHRVWQAAVYEKVPLCRIGIETENDICITLFRQKYIYTLTPAEKVELYLPRKGCVAELQKLRPLNKDFEIWGLDYQGIGESIGYGGLDAPYQEDYFISAHGLMLDKPFIGRRVSDVLKTVRLLKEKGAKEIIVRPQGHSIIVAVFAAVLSDIPFKVILHGDIPSFHAHTCSLKAPIPQSFIPFNILKVTDIDELLKRYPDKFIIK
ncbi:MAG: acetylxylan esterase [Lentisphaeria bacterium]|nr:acetylxylan esterase [Lentisphaeria bacterium]